ncbi:hypothetical protein BV25DRAFT_1841778 [Artomyces pyxidatus]|uniref:Uncharacterized protein n=2 Tax=Artomyces pyxidatus TaxID=48021 RepID=A0ACB8SDB9_9AGAM|nr:hypothetical protein BV25DRAFT_1843628 [Artomyces pyxidatus]KAI0057334.1 hypothetical protein BV25DRAFT_1841778 [Artomyces pyxidatus]
MAAPAASPRFYVVFRGTNPGVYSDWAAAAPNVIGIAGAIHRRYPTLAEAHRALDEFQAHEVEVIAAQMQGLAIAGPAAPPLPAVPEPEPEPTLEVAAPSPVPAAFAPAGAAHTNTPAAPAAVPGSAPPSPGATFVPLTSITPVVNVARGYRFFAVARGRQVGIFNHPWYASPRSLLHTELMLLRSLVRPLVEDYPHAMYRTFRTVEEASDWFVEKMAQLE